MKKENNRNYQIKLKCTSYLVHKINEEVNQTLVSPSTMWRTVAPNSFSIFSKVTTFVSSTVSCNNPAAMDSQSNSYQKGSIITLNNPRRCLLYEIAVKLHKNKGII